jgi:hypothetical protein
MADYFTGDLSQDPGWGWGPDENPARAGFDQGVVDSGAWDTRGDGGFLGLTGSQWAGGLKDIGSGLAGAGKTATDSAGRPQQLGNTSQAQSARGQAGGLGQLLALLAARANMFNQAAHQGAVPTPTRPGGGLLGL